MKWCCIGFQSAYESAGQRSIAAVIDYDSENKPEFILQARAFDGTPPQIKPPAPMSLVIENRMQYCPWCGTELQEWYAKHVAVLIRPDLRIHDGL
jgi:hypothetical protein